MYGYTEVMSDWQCILCSSSSLADVPYNCITVPLRRTSLVGGILHLSVSLLCHQTDAMRLLLRHGVTNGLCTSSQPEPAVYSQPQVRTYMKVACNFKHNWE